MDRPAEYSGNINDLRNGEVYLGYGREFSVNDLTPPPSESGAFPQFSLSNANYSLICSLSSKFLVSIEISKFTDFANVLKTLNCIIIDRK